MFIPPTIKWTLQFLSNLPFLQNDPPVPPTTMVVIEMRFVKSVQIRSYIWYVFSPNCLDNFISIMFFHHKKWYCGETFNSFEQDLRKLMWRTPKKLKMQVDRLLK